MRSILLGLLVFLLAGCANSEQYAGNLAYPSWRLGFLAPDYMEVWVETANVEDTRGQYFHHVGSGIVAVRTPPEGKGNSAGWGERFGWGAGRQVPGADLPKRIYVRWQSLAEPQTYRVTLEIPERARQLMMERLDPPCRTSEYRHALTLGLAPGGVIRGWVMSTCGGPIEVLRAQAEIEPKGPYDGASEGKHRPLSDTSKTYIKKHGIPYGSW